MERALLFVDGNAGCALLGEDLQSGEVEFVKIDHEATRGTGKYPAKIACTRAYRRLKARLPNREFSYVWQSPSGGHW